ncbi:hypothetical protein DMH04_07330 [Kibdelosporangium aridum]|uniref:Nucleotidyltransferase family protein n=1 Tax=Kibdelosporangium aridum TaxID=2030 RepID=A0A428ZK49_KIBAR|nr:nucleotidyltransferase family protein [Kibdelosporangium aridum]RSM88457.1 hypothetical protein DMH04_07330 [Kibdelosporangium aridum]
MDLRDVLSHNETLVEVLGRAADLALPGWYLAAGCVCQTVWNVLTGRPPTNGIKDYDLIYFDDTDLSWEAEDAVIRAVGEVFGDVPVEVRNEARVHLWYEEKFGVPCRPYKSTEDAIDSFPAIATCVGVRLNGGGEWQVYAPYGLADAFNLVMRPNRVLAPRAVFDAKAARCRREWPELTVVAWT